MSGLALDEIEKWYYNFYVVIKKVATNYKAYQVVIDKWTGEIMAEPGPNMIWNGKYGKIMNGVAPSEEQGGNFDMTVTPDQADSAANSFLQQRFGPRTRTWLRASRICTTAFTPAMWWI